MSLLDKALYSFDRIRELAALFSLNLVDVHFCGCLRILFDIFRKLRKNEHRGEKGLILTHRPWVKLFGQ